MICRSYSVRTVRLLAVGLCLVTGWSLRGYSQPGPSATPTEVGADEKSAAELTAPSQKASVSGTEKPAQKRSAKPAEKAVTISEKYQELQRLKKKFEDPAFDGYVNLVQVGNAWNRLDSVLLTDVALQLAYGEDVLQRPHRKMTADMALDLAVKLALENDDQKSLDRLARGAELYHKTEMVERIKTMRDVSHASRGAGIPLSSLKNVPPKAYQLYQTAVKDLTRCRMTQDVQLLKKMEASRVIKSLPEPLLGDIQRQFAELRELLSAEEGSAGKPEVLSNLIRASQLSVPAPSPDAF